MAISLDAQVRVSGGGSILDTATAMRQEAAFGGAVLPRLSTSYSFGTGDSQANAWYLKKRTLAGTTFDNINMTTLEAVENTFSLTRLKLVVVAIISPDGAKSLRVGPQNQANANALWFAGVTANFYDTIYTYLVHDRPITGWTVTAASTDIFTIFNPGGSPLDYAIWLLGLD